VEEYARETLGMDAVQSYQIEYVSLSNSDRAEVFAAPSEESENLLGVITKNLNILAEYLSR
jgi:hypothetical protein